MLSPLDVFVSFAFSFVYPVSRDVDEKYHSPMTDLNFIESKSPQSIRRLGSRPRFKARANCVVFNLAKRSESFLQYSVGFTILSVGIVVPMQSNIIRR